MIKVKVTKNNKSIKSIIIHGHAMYDDYGKDIVCSSVSTCVITTINGILEIDSSAINVSKHDAKITILVIKDDLIINKLLFNMLDILKELESQYPNNISIN